jgi:hypothetical protein
MAMKTYLPEPKIMKTIKRLINHNLMQLFLIACILLSSFQLNAQTIVYPSDGSNTELHAAKEVRRYIFLRTGVAPELVAANNYSSLPEGDVIVISEDSRDIITELKQEYGNVDAPESDGRMGYIIKSVDKGDGRDILVITGADSITTLNAAYRFAELLGCHFNLAGDVIPDQKLSYPLTISGYDEKSQPWFELRGCLPFHNFPTGPDLWSTADYKSFISQQAKMGFNFFGLHHYPNQGEQGTFENGDPLSQEGPEPTIWMGHIDDVNPDGTIKEEAAYTSYWASTFRKGNYQYWDDGIWGYRPVQTSDFSHGADRLFVNEYFASDAIGSKEPTTPAEKAANFNNVGMMFRSAFSHAKQLGVKTAIGHEAPLGIEPGSPTHLITENWIRSSPPDVQTRMRDVHGYTLPTERGYENELYTKGLLEGMFTRIARTHPLDYYWIWTYETWSFLGHRPSTEQKEAIADDYRYCSEVMEEMDTPFKLATFGWKVGSVGSGTPLEFHDDLPLDVPFGTLWDMGEGLDQVINAGREGWSSCWYEEDWGMIQPQLRVMGIYNEVAHGSKKGEEGVQALIAKHWRINSLAPMSAAHAQLAWDNRGPVESELPELGAYPTIDIWSDNIDSQDTAFVSWITAFYQNWAKVNFGPERSTEIGSLLAIADRLGEPKRVSNKIKGAIPRTCDWDGPPSVVKEVYPEEGDDTTFASYEVAFDIYHQFCSYKDDIVGVGNRDRYMYWYHCFKSQLEMGRLAILKALYIHSRNKGETDRAALLKDSITNTWGRVMKHEIQRVRNVSELGIIVQLQQATWDHRLVNDFGWDISNVSMEYEGENAVRAMPEITQIYEDESFEQKVIFLGIGAITNPKMYYREIGSSGSFLSVSLTAIGSSDNIMMATLANPGYDFEYYIQGSFGNDTVTYPVTGGDDAININKTVITVEEVDFDPEELEPLGPIIDRTYISPQEANNTVFIYPNPVINDFRVETTDKIESIRIHNTVGDLLLQDNNPNGIVSMNDFSRGLYVVQVKTNKRTEFIKLIKQ